MQKLQGRFRYFRTVVRPIGIMSNVSFVQSGSSANERPSKEYVDAFVGIACFEVESRRITAYELCEPSSIDGKGYITTFTSLAVFLPDYGRDLRKLQHLVHKIKEKMKETLGSANMKLLEEPEKTSAKSQNGIKLKEEEKKDGKDPFGEN